MNDFARDNELKTRGNRVGLWSLVKTSVWIRSGCVCAVHSLMSSLGQKQTLAVPQPMSACPQIAPAKAALSQTAMSALPPKADMCSALAHVGFGPIADIAPFIRSHRRRGQGPNPESSSRF